MKTSTVATLTLAVLGVAASNGSVKPWNRADAVIIPDPYEGNRFDFGHSFADPKIKAVILRGAQGLRVDGKVRERAAEATARGVRFGIYLLGLSGTPHTNQQGRSRPGVDAIEQADLLVKLGRETGATLLALDIEGTAPNFMSLPDAARFIQRVKDATGRYPAFYTSGGVASSVARRYDASSVFAQAPLWIAAPSAPFAGNRVWPRYALWQFGAEWDCPKAIRARPNRYEACKPYSRYPVAGSDYDLDVNLLNGGTAELEALFGPAPKTNGGAGA